MLLFFISNQTIFSQQSKYKTELYTTENGLSHNYVNCIAQDSYGFMWFGTHKGLNRFDGYNFKSFYNNPKDTCSIVSGFVEDIAEDNNGNLWIATIKGLDKFDCSNEIFLHVSHWSPDTNFQNAHVKCVVQDKMGNIWVGTYGNGLFKINPSKSLVAERILRNDSKINFINDLYVNNSDTLWIGTYESGLHALNLRNNKLLHYEELEVNKNIERFTVMTIKPGHNNVLFLTTWAMGVYVLNITTGQIAKYSRISDMPIDPSIVSYVLDKDGQYWFATFKNGLIGYDPKYNSIVNFRNENPAPYNLKSNMVWSVFDDKYGVIWVGTYGSGILKIVKNNSNFQNISTNSQSGLLNPYITAVSVAENNNLFVGTSFGLHKYNCKTGRFTYLSQFPFGPISDKTVCSMKKDKEGNVWIGFYGGVNIYNERTGRIKYLNPNSLITKPSEHDKDINYTSIAFEKDGDVWFGTFDYGLYRYSPSSQKCVLYKYDDANPNSISNNISWTLLCDSYDNLWVGTRNGLNLYNREKDNFIRYFPDRSSAHAISHEVISMLFEDSQRNLWVATLGGGINKYRRTSNDFIHYSIPEGFPDDNVAGIVEDRKHNFWISTIKSISFLNPQTGTIKNYDKNSGLPDNTYNLGVAILGPENKVYFGGNSGLNFFNADSIKDFKESPSIVITDFKRLNKSVLPGEKIDGRVILPASINEVNELILNYNDYEISFEFACLDFISPMANRYAFKLEGFDNDWKTVDAAKREASYTNLKPGNYTFRLKATNHLGLWGIKEKVLKITIEPPYWQTLWFRVLLLAIIMLAIFVFISYRIKRFKQREVELKKLVAQKTQELILQNHMLEETNKELNKQKADILEMTKRMQEADERKINFFTNISHELRTPLSLILGPVEYVMKHAGDDKDSSQQLSIAHRNAKRLLHLINELLDFQKIDNQSMSVNLSESNIVKYIRDVVYAFEPVAMHNNISLYFETNVEAFTTLFDSDKVEIILYNVISNAIKYSGSGQTVYTNVVVEPHKHTIKIRIKDNGIGIATEHLNKIFDRYFRVEENSSRKVGTGIGLALTKELVILMDGNIEVRSELGKGTEFEVTLPFITNDLVKEGGKYIVRKDSIPVSHREEYIDILKDYELAEQEIDENNDSLKKILVIDDNPDIRTYVKICLRERYNVFEAENGMEGMQLAKHLMPHLIISDIMMPEVDGIALCQQLKENIATSHIPVILLTAKALQEVQIESYQTGADDFITKPFQAEVLLARIENLINSRDKLRQLFKKKLEVIPSEMTETSVDEKFMIKALEIVEKNIDNPDFGSAELVSELNMSRTVVHLKFKKLADVSTSEFIKNIRLKKACQLLKQNKHRVSDVCYMVGFTDPKYFRKSFKKLFGYAPSQYADDAEELTSLD